MPQCPESPDTQSGSDKMASNRTNLTSACSDKDEQHASVKASQILRQNRNSSDVMDFIAVPVLGYQSSLPSEGHASHTDQGRSFYAKTAYTDQMRQVWKTTRGYGSVFNRLQKYRDAITQAQQRRDKLV